MPFTEIQLLAWWGRENRHYCNIEQYRMLERCSGKKDLREWNVWRIKNPDTEIFLQGADLKGFYLRGADLRMANFQGANCLRTDFQEANCQGAKFTMANCQVADFEDSNCREAHFFNANCQAAHFRHANCQDAFFFDAKCQATNFQSAHCLRANFLSANCLAADFTNANCQEANFWGSDCQNANFTNAHCDSADFGGSNCQQTNFEQAHCRNVDFTHADCQGSLFIETVCQKAKFLSAKCRGSHFVNAKLDGTEFCGAVFSRETRFVDCAIDDHTDCTDSNVAVANIERGERARLERNIRYRYWEKWYEPAPPKVGYKAKYGTVQQTWYSRLSSNTWYQNLVTSPVRAFWWISDYSYNTKRILGAFLVSIIIFATLYTIFPGQVKFAGVSIAEMNYIDMLVFAASNMITLGFNIGDIGVGAPIGIFIVVFNFLVGYILFAALVLRLSVLLQTRYSRGILLSEDRKLSDSL